MRAGRLREERSAFSAAEPKPPAQTARLVPDRAPVARARVLSVLTLSFGGLLAGCTGGLDASDPSGRGPGSLFATPAARAFCGPECEDSIRIWTPPCFGEGCAPEADAGMAMVGDDAGVPHDEPDAGAPPVVEPPPPPTPCVRARRLFHEDFETGDYSRWTGGSYDNNWGNHCQNTGFSNAQVRSGSGAHRSEVVCRSHDSVHRGYGGVQFDGERVMPRYTNSGVGLEAPHGVVNTFWSWLDSPYQFVGGRWFSFWTVNSACNYTERVVTLGLEDATNRITPAHIWDTGGQVIWSPGAPAFPMRQWARITVYVNYQRGEMHVWQNGQSVFHATFRRPTNDMCQWHWGMYASGDNTDIVLFEDDISLWKLEEPWTDFSVEPWFEGTTNACE